jgi:hypothetical protein
MKLNEIPRLTEKDKKRFFDKVKKTKGCWEWIASKNQYGYGHFWINKFLFLASHRISWMIHNGKIPKGICVLHHCDNPSCVRPDHLWLGTKGDNAIDMVRKGRNKYGDVRGEKNGCAKLVKKQILKIKKLWITKKFIQKELAKNFGISQQQISRILNRNRWKHVN